MLDVLFALAADLGKWRMLMQA